MGSPDGGLGRQEKSTGRDAVALTCETEVQHLAAGCVIIHGEEGRLALSSFRFLPLGGQAALGARQLVLGALRVACLPIRFAGTPQSERHVAIMFRFLEQGRRTIKRRCGLGRIPLQQEDVPGEPLPGRQQWGIGDVMLVRFGQRGPGARRVVLLAGDRPLQQRGLKAMAFIR